MEALIMGIAIISTVIVGFIVLMITLISLGIIFTAIDKVIFNGRLIDCIHNKIRGL